MPALVGQCKGATGALQATQAGNQLLALQAQQLADLTDVVAANGRAQALSEAERAAAAEQGREQRRRVLTPGSGYQAGNASMFPNRSEEHTSELKSLMRNSYDVFCLKTKNIHQQQQ